MAKGNYAAYQQIKRSDIGLDNTIARNERNQFHYREEKRRAEEAERERLDNLVKDFGLTQDALKQEITGINNIDEGIAAGIDRARNMALEAYNRLRKNPDDFKAKLYLQNIDNYAENVKAFTDRYQKYTLDMAKGISDGTYDPILNKERIDGLNNIYRDKNFVLGVDKNGYPLMAIKDPNGSLKIHTMQDVFDGEGLKTPALKANANKWAVDTAKRYGKLTKERDASGFGTREYIGFDDSKLDQLNKDISSYIGVDDSTITDAARSIWVSDLKQNLSDLDSNGLEKIKEYLRNKTINTFDTTDKITTDYGARNAASRLAFDRKKHEEEKLENMVEIEVDRNADGSLLKVESPGGGDPNSETYSFSPAKPIVTGTKDQPVEIQKLFMDTDGNLSYTGRYKTGEESVKDGDVTIKRPVYQPISGSKFNSQKLNTVSRLIINPKTKAPFKDQSELVEFLSGKITEKGSDKQKLSW